ncbi:DNA polymerase III, beta subunit [Candidatus Electrothrix aarhusensis]|jgi:DNA polymerase-3 subunit beta|uniref:Beta sliding clamp n=2 Tax=Candidatus Electrothrix TaxID=1859128 RepID=A0A444IXA0_9BACT|nr:DNA polymerase III, beta subunit [Candidatus Electrothrix aarhusensis]
MPFHFNIAREDLLRAINAQQQITNKKGTLAILANVLMEVENNEIVFTATDLEISLRQTVPAEVFEVGSLTIPSKKLFELARESGSPTLNFKEGEKNWINITAGSSTYKLAGMATEEFPQFEQYNEEDLTEIQGEVFCDLIDKTIFSVATEKENMYNLNAALFQQLIENDKTVFRMVTSDGHRLSIMRRETEGAPLPNFDKFILIPRRGIQQIRKFGEEKDTFQFGVEKKKVVLKSDNAILVIRLMEGEFPDFENILNFIPKESNIFINKILFLESLKRINLFTEDMFHAIKFELGDNQLVLTSEHADFGSARDEIAIEYSGEKLSMGFNCRYFMEALQVMEGENIQACISSNESPCLITSEEDEGFLGIIMPMKLS